MEVKFTAKFYYKNSRDSTSITWVEKNPKIIQRKKDSDEILREITLTVEGVKQEYRKLLVNYKNEGKTFSVQDVNGKIHLIDLTEVRHLELDAVEIQNESKQSNPHENFSVEDVKLPESQFSPQSGKAEKEKPRNIVEAMGVKPKRHTLN